MAAGMSMDMSSLIPGMNPSGSNNSMPGGGAGSGPAIGGNTNPLLPTFASGQNMPSNSNSLYGGGAVPMSGAPASATVPGGGGGGFPANGPGGTGAPGSIPSSGSGFDLASALGLGQGDPNWMHNLVKGLHKAGYSSGVAGQLGNFLQSGAGFNQDILNHLLSSIFAAQQPQINRGEADIAERFGSMGLGMSSPAAIGMGDFLSQVSLGQGELAAGLEESMWNQSVQNYMNVLMGGKGPAPHSTFQNIIDWISTMSQFMPGK